MGNKAYYFFKLILKLKLAGFPFLRKYSDHTLLKVLASNCLFQTRYTQNKA